MILIIMATIPTYTEPLSAMSAVASMIGLGLDVERRRKARKK